MNETGRIEAFSDGVFAIAITLLVLEIKVPRGAGSHLWSALGQQWPSYAAYVVSFVVIGIMWANHHTLFGYIARADRTLVFLNIMLLLVVAAIPWPAALVAEYLDQGSGAHVAVAVYSGVMVALAVAFTAFWWYATGHGNLLDDRVDRAAARASRRRFGFGLVAYPATVGLAFLSAPLTLLVHLALAVYYAFNQVSIPMAPARRPTTGPPVSRPSRGRPETPL